MYALTLSRFDSRWRPPQTLTDFLLPRTQAASIMNLPPASVEALGASERQTSRFHKRPVGWNHIPITITIRCSGGFSIPPQCLLQLEQIYLTNT